MDEHSLSTRRSVLYTICGVGTASLSVAGSASATERETSDDAAAATEYVAVVDRIVDGEHVVLLLEYEGELVDQLVVSVDAFESVAESDILLVTIADDDLLEYEHVSERPDQIESC
ncbi:hypothetical protein [Natronolimnobius baerhuensis]|uniref:Uncharacterized protein n=1 Tax=Natronolimnobius baerhuensis TaxID=253108 RepID=A0A202E6R2_9EURY|nr:hypothetical protein [Natronolimnobius baerhuensis]OVE83953.1 hypothetical protein B2G88_16215 [Natronolimnobius baerhuensis]